MGASADGSSHDISFSREVTTQHLPVEYGMSASLSRSISVFTLRTRLQQMKGICLPQSATSSEGRWFGRGRGTSRIARVPLMPMGGARLAFPLSCYPRPLGGLGSSCTPSPHIVERLCAGLSWLRPAPRMCIDLVCLRNNISLILISFSERVVDLQSEKKPLTRRQCQRETEPIGFVLQRPAPRFLLAPLL